MTDAQPAIRWTDFMGDREDMERIKLIGPYANVAERNADLAWLASLPLGDRRFNGGQLFFHATMAEAVGQPYWDHQVVAPAQVAKATSQRSFHALFSGYDAAPEPGDDDYVEPTVDPYELHPDQVPLFGGAS